MPKYVYGCHQHPECRPEIIHGMDEDPVIECPECHKPMHRVPQAFRWYNNPAALLLDKLSDRFADYRKEKRYGIKRKYKRGTAITSD
jgi:hypothetical protein